MEKVMQRRRFAVSTDFVVWNGMAMEGAIESVNDTHVEACSNRISI